MTTPTSLDSYTSLAQDIARLHREQLADRSTDLDLPGYKGRLVVRVHPPDFDEDGKLQDQAANGETPASRFDAMAELIAGCATEILVRGTAAGKGPAPLVPLRTIVADGVLVPIVFDERFIRWLLTAEIGPDTPPSAAEAITANVESTLRLMREDPRGASVAAVREVVPYPPNLSSLYVQLVTWIGAEDNAAAEVVVGEVDAASTDDSSVTSPRAS